MSDLKILWEDKKRPFFGLQLSFTKYTLTEEKLLIKTGFLSIKEEEIQLYRITDITLKCSLWQRLFKLGTIHCCSGDRTTPEFNLSDVKNAQKIKEILSKQVELRRDAKNITPKEILDGARHDFHDDNDND